MKLYLEKSMRIVSDLVAYCHSQGGDEYDISIKHDSGLTSLTVSCPIKNLDPNALEELTRELNVQRQYEVEQNYWELSGESEMLVDLTLVGMMLNRANVFYRDGVLHIEAQRRE